MQVHLWNTGFKCELDAGFVCGVPVPAGHRMFNQLGLEQAIIPRSVSFPSQKMHW